MKKFPTIKKGPASVGGDPSTQAKLPVFQEVEDARVWLTDIQAKVQRKTQCSDQLLQSGRDLSRAFQEYSDKENAFDGQLSSCLGTVSGLEDGMNLLLQNLNDAIREKLQKPMLQFIKTEISAATAQMKKYEKLRKDYEAADARFLNLKDSADDRKKFTLEKDRNRLNELMRMAWEDTVRTYEDTAAHNRTYTLSTLVDYLDAYEAFFRHGLDSFAKLRDDLATLRAAGKAHASSSSSFEQEDGAHITREGALWMRTGAAGPTSAWQQRHGILKPGYLFVYKSAGAQELKTCIPLHHCCVVRDTRDERKSAFMINAKMQNWALRARGEADARDWMRDIESCIVDKEEHKALVRGAVVTNLAEDDEDSDDDDDAAAPPGARFLADERRYRRRLERAVKVYEVPMKMDTQLNVPASDLNMLFGNLRDVAAVHVGLAETLAAAGDARAAHAAALLRARDALATAYLPYVRGVDNALYTLEALKKNHRGVRKYLHDLELALGDGNELSALLARPIGRVDELARYAESVPAGEAAHVPEAQRALRALADEVAEAASFSKHIAKVSEVRDRLEGFEGGLVDTRRYFVREGAAMVFRKSDLDEAEFAPLHCVLFNDLLLAARPRGARAKMRLQWQIPMFKIELGAQPAEPPAATTPPTPFLVRLLVGSRKAVARDDVYLALASAGERDRWAEALAAAVAETERTRKVFGTPLEVLMQQNREKGRLVPSVVARLKEWIVVNALDQEGLFRLPGRLDDIEAFKDSFNRGQPLDLVAGLDHKVVTGMLTHFLMEMPEPLLTKALYRAFVDAAQRSDEVAAITTVVQQLPDTNRFMLQEIAELLVQVRMRSETNKMHTKNLSLVFGPSLMCPQDGNQLAMLEDYAHSYTVVEVLIDQYDTVFATTLADRTARLAEMAARDASRQKAEATRQAQLSRAIRTPPGGPNSGPNSGAGPDGPPARPPPAARRGASTRAATRGLPLTPGGGKPLPARPPGGPPPPGIGRPPGPKPLPVPAGFASPAGSAGAAGFAAARKDEEDEEEDEDEEAVSAFLNIGKGVVLKEGWLQKKGDRRRNWTTRWCVLKDNGQLAYYKQKKDAKPKGVVFLNNAQIRESSHKAFCFTIETPARVWVLTARDAEDQREWMDALHLAKS